MNLSGPFIRRPVGTSLLAIGVLLAGVVAFRMLPTSSLPQVDYPVINASVKFVGASADTMASSVATPLERQFGRIAGLTALTSTSNLGRMQVVLEFDLDRDIDGAARDVQAAINAARGQLPSNLPQNPSYSKSNPADPPILIVELTSDELPRPRVYDIADSILSQRIAQLPGVGQVNIRGGATPAVRVELNPTLLNQLGIGTEQVRTALKAANAFRPKGALSNATTMWPISADDQIVQAAQYRPLIIGKSKNGSTVRLRDLGEVEDSVEDLRTLGIANRGEEVITMEISRQPGANIIATADRVKDMLKTLQASIPPSVKVIVLQDRTTTIRASIKDIEMTLVISFLLVVVVVFVFLRDFWSTLIPSVAIPISLIGTFGAMYLLHYSLDNLSLMALAISTGFVVDDAIVVLENITRYVEQGLRPFEAALVGAKEIGFTVLSMSASLSAVFIPILLMSGIVGRLFREFAVTMSVAIAFSLVVSLTVTPMMCSKLLRNREEHERSKLFRWSEAGFQGILNLYEVCLRWVLRHQPLILAATVATACLSVYLYVIVQKGFFPQQDTGRLVGTLLGQQDISFPAMHEKMDQFFKIVMSDPAVESANGTVGGTATTLNNGRINIQLIPMEKRDVNADQVINRLRGKLAAIPGARLLVQSSQELQIGGRTAASQYQYTLQGESMAELNTWAPRLMEAIGSLPELRDVATDQQSKGLEAKLVVDRNTASRLGIPAQAVDAALFDAFGQEQVLTLYRPLNQYHVVMEVAPQFQHTPDAFRNVFVRSTNGKEVPLSAFSHFEPSSMPILINHQGQFPAVTLSFNLAPGVSLGDATKAIEKAQRDIGLPASIHAFFYGAAAAFQSSLASEPYLILAALIAVYIVLGILYESYIHPITILSTLPSAGVGALLALWLTHSELNVIGLIGILLLIGLVKKNAIMMIDFALDAQRRENKPAVDAIYQACVLRFRPIMMTTMGALLGGLPLALATGTGYELRRPLGITIIGGLIVSQMLTLFTTPVVYLWFDRWAGRFSRLRFHKPISATAK